MSRLLSPECTECGLSFAVSEDDVRDAKLHCPGCGECVELDEGDEDEE